MLVRVVRVQRAGLQLQRGDRARAAGLPTCQVRAHRVRYAGELSTPRHTDCLLIKY